MFSTLRRSHLLTWSCRHPLPETAWISIVSQHFINSGAKNTINISNSQSSMSNEISPSQPSIKDPIIKGLQLNLNYANDGHLVPSLSKIEISKLELSKTFGFELRDLRALHNNTFTTASNKYASPTFFIRQYAFLAHLKDITALISADKCYLFNVITDQNQDQTDDDYMGSDDDSDTENNFKKDSDQIAPAMESFDILNKFIAKLQSTLIFNTVPFEFHCLEGVCKAVVSKHRKQLTYLENITTQILKETEQNDDCTDKNNISMIKLELIKAITNSKSCVDAVTELLNNSEDLGLMYLTDKKSVNNKQLELLLENYLWQFDEILDRLQLLLDELTMFERSIGFLINKQRNEIIRMNLKLSVLTCSFSCGALCAGIFGMNLLSTFEAHPYAFWMGATSFGILVPLTVWRHFKAHLQIKI